MKKKLSSKSAFFNVRVLIALFVFLAGVFLALVGFGAFSSVSAQANGTKSDQQTKAAPGLPDVVAMVGPVRLDQDLRSLPYVAPKPEHEERRLTRHPFPLTGPHGPAGSATASPFAQ